MLTFNQIATFLSASGSGENIGKSAVTDGVNTTPFYGAHTSGNPQKIFFIIANDQRLELQEAHTLVKLP